MPKIQLTITLTTETGEVRADGPIHDKILSLGLLELAKTIVLKFGEEKKQVIVPKIVPFNAEFMKS